MVNVRWKVGDREILSTRRKNRFFPLPGWLLVNKGFAKVLKEWIRDKLTSQSDVYFVTLLQVKSFITNSKQM